MALIKRTELKSHIQANDSLDCQIFLFFGERYLCRQAAEQTIKLLLREETGAVHSIDGDNEDPGRTLASLLSFSLLPGRQIYHITDSRIFHSRQVASEIWDKALQSHLENRVGPATKNLLAMIQAAGLRIDSQSPLVEMEKREWSNLFNFEKPSGDLSWADKLLFAARDKLKASSGNIADQYIATFDKGLPPANVLLLSAETVDKRQRLFNYFKKNGTVVDCTVAAGSSASARDAQKNVLKELMLKTLAEFNKKIDTRAADHFFERVGFHPVGVVMETEKLCHFVGDRPNISLEDLETMVARSREDALYELTDAFGKRQTDRTLRILNRLLGQGIHSLAILATMRNYLRKLLIFRSLQFSPSPIWTRGMNAKEFQSRYLPELKAQGEWTNILGGHPYALFMSFTKASEFSCSGLQRWLYMLLDAEFRLKGSPLPPVLILEELFISMLKGTPKLPR